MMFTAKMKYLVAVVLDKHADQVTKELLALSLLHFVKITELDAGLETKVNSVVPTLSTTRLAEIRRRIESFLSIIKLYPAVQKQVELDKLATINIDTAEKQLDEIAAEIQAVRDRQKSIQQEILRLEDIKRQVLLFGDLRSSINAGSRYSFLDFQSGIVSSTRVADFQKDMEAFPSVVLTFHEEDAKTYVLVITMKRDQAQVNVLFEKYNFIEVEVTEEMLGVREEVTVTLEKKMTALSAEQEKLHTQSQELIVSRQDKLLAMWENLKLNELYYQIQSYFSKTNRTVLFSGWVPASKKSLLEEGIGRITNGRCYIEWRDPENIEKETHKKVRVPVKLQNLKLLSPFQMLVTNYSIPEYKTIDPTPIVAVIYLIMFGLMFADAGQGLVLMLIGILGVLFGRFKAGLRELVKLLIFCGGAAIVAGVLFGSYFGFELFPPIWFNFRGLVTNEVPVNSPIQSILQVLAITLYFGIGVIALGLVLNWINLIRTRNWLKLIFDRTGFVGSWMYFGGVYAGYYFVTHDFKGLPDETTLLLLLGIPALLFMGKPIGDFFKHKKHDPNVRFTVFTPLVFVGEWLLEMLEFFSGYLSNTLSFMRVAGLGIAHVALTIAFSQIAGMLGSGGSFTVLSWLVIVIGNIFIIALEGLSAGIQSLRLNYYEFFSKYFRGSGEAYAPVSLKGP